MKYFVLFFIMIFFSFTGLFSQEKSGNYYSQLLGFKGGGEFFVYNFQSDWSMGVFFENVISPLFGMEIEIVRSTIPVTNYSSDVGGVPINVTGNGKREYIEISGAIKVYIKGVSICLGLTYNDFISGYIVEKNTSLYTPMSEQEINYFSVFFGPELTTQISQDLFARVGLKGIYGFINVEPNYTFGIRFYIAFAYGI